MDNIISKTNRGDTGTKEWADKTVNCCTGCSNNCLYCYARQMAVRFGRVTEDQWLKTQIREHDVTKKHKNYGVPVMFPSSHDITKDNLNACRTVLQNLLSAGNEVLVVTKPDPFCVQALCGDCNDYKEQIIFRFTIGAMDSDLLALWEPGAPTFEEKMEALTYSFEKGFETSVSVEPMVDADNVTDLVGELLPYVTETIWIGKMNYLGRIKVDSDKIADAVEQIRVSQADDKILDIYNNLKNIPQIRWKDSIRRVVEK